MYRIRRAPDYSFELEQLEHRFPDLEQALQGGVYFSLLGVPQDGWPLRGTDLWYMSQIIGEGRFVARVYYRVQERPKVVTLVSIRVVDRSVM